MQKVADAIYGFTGRPEAVDLSPDDPVEALMEAAVVFAGYHLRHTVGERQRLGLEVAKTLAAYVAFEQDGEKEGIDAKS